MNFLEKIKIAILNSLSVKNTDSRRTNERLFRFVVAIALFLASVALTILNIVNKKTLMMTITTSGLIVGFGLCAVLYIFTKLRHIPNIIMSLMCVLVFSIYTIYGENEGFAALWILIVPPIAMNILGLIEGTLTSFYFQLFLIVVFYTPLKDVIPGSDVIGYTQTFLIRFPILYFVIFASSFFFTCQKEYYFYLTENLAFIDVLTSLKNRRYYEDLIKKIEEDKKFDKLNLVSIDLNRLKYYNDNFGHMVGDQVIIAAGKLILDGFSDAFGVCRTGGDEFIVLCYADESVVQERIESLKTIAKSYQAEHIDGIDLSIGYASENKEKLQNVASLQKIADEMMYEDKNKYYKETGFDRRK